MGDDEYFAIKHRATATLFKIPGVTGVGIGGRERGGQPTGEIVITVFVKRKKAPSEIPAGEMIPASFEGVTTDVVEMDVPEPHVAPCGAGDVAHMEFLEENTAPMRGGMNIRVEGVGGGTLGCFLIDRDDATAVYGLTNHHVVTNGALSLSRRIMCSSVTPGTFTLVGYVAAGANEPRRDAALVRLVAGSEWLPAIKEIGFVKGRHTITAAEVATLQYPVRKWGSRTRLTGGVVIAIGTVWALSPSREMFDIVIRPNAACPPFLSTAQVDFSHKGDSGSAVVNDDNQVIALIWGGDTDSSKQFRTTVATPIDIVLDRFKEIDKLDLEVATNMAPIPDDTTELRKVKDAAGAPVLTIGEMAKIVDQRNYRPLSGGSQIAAHPFAGPTNSGTLGCIVKDAAHPGGAYALTAYGPLSGNGIRAPTTDTDVGQPDNDGSCSLCCDNTIGEFFRGGPDNVTMPAALVKVEEDVRWLAEVMQIGLIDSVAPPLAKADVESGKFQVLKRGVGTRLTGGVIVAVGGVSGTLPQGARPDAIVIRPNPNEFRSGQAICFSNRADRGALVFAFNRVVGLLYDEAPPELIDGISVVHGLAMPIQKVLDGLNALPGISIEVPTAFAPDRVQVAKRVVTEHDVAMPPLVAIPRPPREPVPGFDRLRGELSLSPAGRLAIVMWSEHGQEIRHLINHHRKVATVWHRSGGPAILQALIRVLQVPSAIVPAFVNGMEISACVDRIASTLRKYGSMGLRASIGDLHPRMPSIAGLTFTEISRALESA